MPAAGLIARRANISVGPAAVIAPGETQIPRFARDGIYFLEATASQPTLWAGSGRRAGHGGVVAHPFHVET